MWPSWGQEGEAVEAGTAWHGRRVVEGWPPPTPILSTLSYREKIIVNLLNQPEKTIKELKLKIKRTKVSNKTGN